MVLWTPPPPWPPSLSVGFVAFALQSTQECAKADLDKTHNQCMVCQDNNCTSKFAGRPSDHDPVGRANITSTCSYRGKVLSSTTSASNYTPSKLIFLQNRLFEAISVFFWRTTNHITIIESHFGQTLHRNLFCHKEQHSAKRITMTVGNEETE